MRQSKLSITGTSQVLFICIGYFFLQTLALRGTFGFITATVYKLVFSITLPFLRFRVTPVNLEPVRAESSDTSRCVPVSNICAFDSLWMPWIPGEMPLLVCCLFVVCLKTEIVFWGLQEAFWGLWRLLRTPKDLPEVGSGYRFTY